MVAVEVSGSLIVRDKTILMIETEEGKLDVPSGQAEHGELGTDTAERVANEATQCSSKTLKYKKQLKTSFEKGGEEFKWQSYTVEIEGEPENGEWIPIHKLESKELVSPLKEIKEKLTDRL